LDKINVAIIGATGVVGQQFILALHDHPWFTISNLTASSQSSHKSYQNALRDPATGALRWFSSELPPKSILELPVSDLHSIDLSNIDLVFTAVSTQIARKIEGKLAKYKPVISTARAYRYEPDVPIILPGINLSHASLIHIQQKKRAWKGFIIPQPNCTATGLAYSLKPILDAYGLEKVLMTSLQAVSGAGRSPGVSALDIIGNVIPYIPGEEEAVEKETVKILGSLTDNQSISPAPFSLSCTCTRVGVLDGHTESVFLSTQNPCSVNDVIHVMRHYSTNLHPLNLPSAPHHLLVVQDDPYRPQPRLDLMTEEGMATTIGRIRKDITLKNGIKYVLLSHNTKMGAAKGAVLVAEFLHKEHYF
jgi:aspartate-semialdehyde dehydrogenase